MCLKIVAIMYCQNDRLSKQPVDEVALFHVIIITHLGTCVYSGTD
jgi:hypothetical protein